MAVAGEVFTKAEAEKYYGPVRYNVDMPASEAKNIVENTNDKFMFKVDENGLRILNNGREGLYPPDAKPVDEKEVFNVVSLSVFNELLAKGAADDVSFEQRINTGTITNGESTLEKVIPCPPDCPCPPFCD